MDKKKKVLDFISSQNLGVLSSINSEGKPQSALIGIGQTQNLELIIGTSNKTRKYKNLILSPNVSVVIGWGSDNTTVQYEGKVIELEGEEKDMLTKIFYDKNETARRFKDDPSERYFKIIPTWIRFSDLGKGEIFELTF